MHQRQQRRGIQPAAQVDANRHIGAEAQRHAVFEQLQILSPHV
jgi:hypothetical protein